MLNRLIIALCISCSVSLTLAPGVLPVRAQSPGVSFAATVDDTTVELGSFVRLTLTVNGVQNVSPFKLPEIDGFQSRYLGPSTRVSIVNGNYSSSIAFLYALYPQKEGKFTIPALEVTIEGQKYSSRAISLEVTAAGSTPTAAGQPAGGVGAQNSAPASLSDRLFITLESSPQAYQGERVPIKIKLFVNGVSVKNVQMPEFEHTGFQTDDFDKPRQYTQVVNGLEYQVVEFSGYVYPTRTGDLTLGPAKMNCEVLSRSASRQPRGGSDSFFDDDFFDNFFGNYDVRTLSLESKPVTLAVRSLPEQDQPKDFSGGIGKFDFTMTVSPKDVKVGDPLTVRMKLSGQGNMKSVLMPSLENIPGLKDQFKLYDPQVFDKDGDKVLEQVIIPKTEKVKSVPAVIFSFFDTEDGKYHSISQGPFDVNVSPLAEGDKPRMVAPALPTEAGSPSQEIMGQDIIFIKNSPGSWQRREEGRGPPFIFWILCAGVLVAWTSLWSYYKVNHKLKTDERFARRLLAPRRAKQGLALAERHLKRQETKEFFDAVYKTLQDYFNGRFHLASGNITVEAIEALLNDQPRAMEVLEKIRKIFAQCDAMRYGASPSGEKEMEESYQQLREILDYFERL